MGLLDNVVEGFSEHGGSDEEKKLQQGLVDMLGRGGTEGFSGIARNFESQGLGHVFSSWVSNGQNQPVQPQDVQKGLGEEKVQELANRAGLPVQAALPLLAKFLPGIIDRLTPQGHLPAHNGMLQQGLNALLAR